MLLLFLAPEDLSIRNRKEFVTSILKVEDCSIAMETV